jgi:cobalt-zinc-cadmium efflux system membrane fusion protein
VIRLFPLVAGAAALLVLAACGDAPPSDAESPGAAAPAGPLADTATLSAEAVAIGGFDTVAVVRAPWRESWTAPARLTLDVLRSESLGAIVEGRVKRVFALQGDPVRAGQVLVSIHSHELMDARLVLAEAQASVAQAEAQLGVATSGAARAERLHAIKSLSLADLERAQATRVEAVAARERAQAELERGRALVAHLVGTGPVPEGVDDHDVLIRAPFDGVVITREAQPGAVVLVGAPLMTVSRAGAMSLMIHLPQRATQAAEIGAPVRFTVATLPDRTFEGRVVRIAPSIDSLTRTLEVFASVDDPRRVLRPEMFATAQILGRAMDAVVQVPAAAVQAIDGDTVLIAADKRGEGLRLEARRVRIGRRTPEVVEVVAGADTGMAVVVRGAAIARAELLRRRGGSGGEH